MKFKDLIKADWPEKRNASSYDSDSEWCDGYDACLAAIEPIKELEVGVDVARLRYILLDRNPMGIKIHESVEETIEALAANLDKILVVEKGK